YTNDTPLATLGGRNPLNPCYRPWGVNGRSANDTVFPTMKNLFVKDPMVTRSDDWDFEASKFANPGWLGRIHRGSPWQTIYLKSPATDTNFAAGWGMWSGHVITNWDGFGSVAPDFALTSPTNDYHILDLFTTAFTENASKGQMSVNQ